MNFRCVATPRIDKGPILIEELTNSRARGEKSRSKRAFRSRKSPKIFVCTVPPGTVLIQNELKFTVPKLWQLAVFCTCRNLSKELRFAKKFPLRKQWVSELLFSNFVMRCHTLARQWIHFELTSRLLHKRAIRIRIALLWFDSRASSALPHLR